MLPETRYAKSGDVHIAYQVVGDGPLDLVCIMPMATHIEVAWEEPTFAHYLRRLAAFSRLILFDKRGTGLSDRVPNLPILEQRMDDVRAVMDAAGSERAALFGGSEGGSMSILFAATYPERTAALVLYGAFARRVWAPDYPWAPTVEERQRYFEWIEANWGRSPDVSTVVPGRANDERFKQWVAKYQRLAASPGAAAALMRMNSQIDVRHVLPAIRVPTLVLHRVGDLDVDVGNGRYLAEHIPGAKYVELPGIDHTPLAGDTDAILDEIEEFLTGVRPAPEPDRVLATVLFTDIARSTEHATRLGDHRWRELLDEHHALVRRELARHRGQEIDTAGDGFFATFDGPARAVRCAQAIVRGVRDLGIEVRAGLHTGECELAGNRVVGIAVHTGARVMAAAGPSEILVSSTVKDLVAGSGLAFEDRGLHAFKGVPGEWRLYALI